MKIRERNNAKKIESCPFSLSGFKEEEKAKGVGRNFVKEELKAQRKILWKWK